jgi:hypothetical protein
LPPRGDIPPPVQTVRSLPLIARFVGGIAVIFVLAGLTALESHPIELPLGVHEPSNGGGFGSSVDACVRIRGLLDEAGSSRHASGPAEDLADLVPEEPGIASADHGLGQRLRRPRNVGSVPGWDAELERDGFVRGYLRTWSLGARAGASIEISEFEDADGTFAFERFWILDSTCAAVREVFTVDGVSGDIGVRIAWTDGSTSEQVAFVRGARLFVATIRGPGRPDRSQIEALALAATYAAG